MIALDYTVVIQIVSFLFLWLLLAKLLFKPFLGLLEERERRTEGVKAEASSLMEEGQGLRLEYENKIATARDEARGLKETILGEALQARDRFLAQAREDASRLLGQARQEVQQQMERERELAAREAEAIARQMAEKILGRRIA